MKKLSIFLSGLLITALVSCNSGQEKTTERTVLDVDTVDAETEYEVEKTIREKTVTIDTVTETETVTKELDSLGNERQEDGS